MYADDGVRRYTARLPWDQIVNEWKTEAVVGKVVMHQFEEQVITSDVDGYLTCVGPQRILTNGSRNLYKSF